jgi:hypothetical protein
MSSLTKRCKSRDMGHIFKMETFEQTEEEIVTEGTTSCYREGSWKNRLNPQLMHFKTLS